jgi:hypothetical protein
MRNPQGKFPEVGFEEDHLRGRIGDRNRVKRCSVGHVKNLLEPRFWPLA